MTLDEAIQHCEEVSKDCPNEQCSMDHKQLASWLKELKALRGKAKDHFALTIEWKNADADFPGLKNEPIVYCTAKKKVGTLKAVGNHWDWLKEKYNIKWWCYQMRLVP